MRRGGVRLLVPLAACIVALGLSACGEKNQSLPATVKKTSSPAWNGAQNPFLAPGWKPGNQTSWDDHMRTRAQKQN